MFFCKDQDQSVSLDAFQERLRQSQQIHTDNTATLNAALRLLANIREAAGDPQGKLMQDELIAKINRMREALEGIMNVPENQSQHVYGAMVKAIARKALQ